MVPEESQEAYQAVSQVPEGLLNEWPHIRSPTDLRIRSPTNLRIRSLTNLLHPAIRRSLSRPSAPHPLPLLPQLWARLLVATLPPVPLLTLL